MVAHRADGSRAAARRGWRSPRRPRARRSRRPTPTRLAPEAPQPDAPRSIAVGVPWHGRLEHGVQLPEAGTDFVTWDPILRVSPNRDWRRWGTDALIVLLDTVTREFREAHPDVPPILIADLSRPQGGPFGPRYGGLGHGSHQNGLDADVMYPRRDRAPLRGPAPGGGRSRAGPGPRRPLPRGRRRQALRRAAPAPARAARDRRAARPSRRPRARADRQPGRATRLTRLERAPHEEHRHARPAPARRVGGLADRLDEQPGVLERPRVGLERIAPARRT